MAKGHTNRYCVWRRQPDGYVAASNGGWPAGWTQPNDGTVVTFDKLGEFDNWPDAYNLIVAERAKEGKSVEED